MRFNYACSDFAQITFNRKLIDCFLQSNDYFAMKLSNLILGSVLYDDDDELIGILDGPGVTSTLIIPAQAQLGTQAPILHGVVHHEPTSMSTPQSSDTDESA